ncbi:hypothetical protein CAEBREN_14172 [Caenorhabditis brenneri]|uniref:Fork-head domain-containing protein n=1 Tax=Caenorhabditis brenneri TaxID=135651 RepID=G0NKI3_CAEBE|nr:hypothetical protein CAEBREN_14172 [Caenorhabditis brenneri]
MITQLDVFSCYIRFLFSASSLETLTEEQADRDATSVSTNTNVPALKSNSIKCEDFEWDVDWKTVEEIMEQVRTSTRAQFDENFLHVYELGKCSYGKTYKDLIVEALRGSPENRLKLKEIYEAIQRLHPWEWQNSIRHNLSIHDCFVKEDIKGSKTNYLHY